MPGFNMKMDCRFKLSPFCGGVQDARVERWTMEDRWESGKVSRHTEKRIVERLTQCH
jgi:hypothetical protein